MRASLSWPRIVALSSRSAPCGSVTGTSVDSTPTCTRSCAAQVSVCVCVHVAAHACCGVQCFQPWCPARVSLQLVLSLVSHCTAGASIQCVLCHSCVIVCVRQGVWTVRQAVIVHNAAFCLRLSGSPRLSPRSLCLSLSLKDSKRRSSHPEN